MISEDIQCSANILSHSDMADIKGAKHLLKSVSVTGLSTLGVRRKQFENSLKVRKESENFQKYTFKSCVQVIYENIKENCP